MKKTVVTTVMMLVVVVLLVSVAMAGKKPETPNLIPGATVVDDAWVFANHKAMKIFDMRKKAEYVEGHLPGALSNPYKEKSAKSVDFDRSMDKLNMSKFPNDKSTPIIVYCNGPRCWKSYKTTIWLIEAGYTKVYQYRNSGFPGWKARGYPVQ